jgi:nucleotide-binding universal stress UspA family protein
MIERRSIMFKRILVPLDGSVRAERALPVAAHLARSAGGGVILTRVVSLPASFGLEGPSPVETETLVTDERETATRYLEEVAQRPDFVGVATHAEARMASVVAPALLEAMQAAHADLVVMCSRGRTGVTRWTLGSVAQKLARHAIVPTLILRSDGPALFPSVHDAPHPTRALVPLDGSPEAEAALEPAAGLIAAPERSGLRLLHVVQLEESPQDVPAAERNAQVTLCREAEEYLHTVAERLKQTRSSTRSPDVTWSIVFDPDVAAAILDEPDALAEGGAEGASVRHSCDVIAMVSHGRSGLPLWTLGSVTDRVLQATKLPLLIIHLSGAAESQQVSRGAAPDQVETEIGVWPGY